MKFYAEINAQNKIIPLYDSDYDILKKIKKNSVLHFEIKQQRNYKFLKKFFALINMLYDNQEKYNNIEYLRKDLIIESGFYEIRYGIHGEEIKEAKSISFANMDETEFSELYNRVIDSIVRCFNFDREDIIENVHMYF